MKLKQDLIIRQYFIDYSLGKYSEDKKPTVPEYLVEELSKPNYEENLEITKLVVTETNVDASFKSSKVVANNQVYDFSKPNELDLFEAKYLDSVTYPTVADIPMDIVDDLVLIEDLEGCKPVIFVNKDFNKLPVEDKFSQLIEIFKNRVRVDYSEPETILGQVFDLDKDSSWDEDLNQLVIVSAVLKGRICVMDDVRRYELKDSHIGKLTHGEDTFTSPWVESSGFLVKDTDGKIHKIYAMGENFTNRQVPEKDIVITASNSGQVLLQGRDIQGLISFPGAFIDNMTTGYGFQLTGPNIVEVPDELPPHITKLDNFLSGSSKFNDPKINDWDYSNLVSMNNFLDNATSFNHPLELNTSNVTSMNNFLYRANSFNQPLNLDTSKVTSLNGFLYNASSFNQQLNIDTSKVTNLNYFLNRTTSFNQPLELDVGNVTKLDNFLSYATKFNQPLELNTSNVTSMSSFLNGATSFNQPLELDVSKVTNISNFLYGATKFNQPLNLDTSNVTNMDYFLQEAANFNSPLTIDTSNVKEINNFLYKATKFDQDISYLCLEKVVNSRNFLSQSGYTQERPVIGECPNGMTVRVTKRGNFSTTPLYIKIGEVSELSGSDIKGEVVGNSIKISGKDLKDIYDIPKTLKKPFVELGVNHLDLSDSGIEEVPKNVLREVEWITSLKETFKNCVNLKKVSETDIICSRVTTIEGMFEGCINLEEVILRPGVLKLEDFEGEEMVMESTARLFKDCVNLETLTLGYNLSHYNRLGFLKVTDTSGMFENCAKLVKFIPKAVGTDYKDNVYAVLDQFRSSILTNTSKMFKNCKLLTGGEVGIDDWSALENADEMFMGCDNMELSITSWCVPKIDKTPKDFATTSKGESVWKTPEPTWGKEPTGITLLDFNDNKFIINYNPELSGKEIFIPGTALDTLIISNTPDDVNGWLSFSWNYSNRVGANTYKVIDIDKNIFGEKFVSIHVDTYSLIDINLDNIKGISWLSFDRGSASALGKIFSKVENSESRLTDLYLSNIGFRNADFSLPKLDPRVIKNIELSSLYDFNLPIEWSEDPSTIDPSELTLKTLNLSSMNAFNQPIEHLGQYNKLEALELTDLDSFDQPISKINLDYFNQEGKYPSISNLKVFNQMPPKPNPKDGSIDLRGLDYLDKFNQDLGDWVFARNSSIDGVGYKCPEWTLPKPSITSAV